MAYPLDRLASELEEYVDMKVATGQFRSREEFAEHAVRVFREIEGQHARLKSDIQAAIEESNAGLSDDLDIEAIQQELGAELDENGRER